MPINIINLLEVFFLENYTVKKKVGSFQIFEKFCSKFMIRVCLPLSKNEISYSPKFLSTKNTVLFRFFGQNNL